MEGHNGHLLIAVLVVRPLTSQANFPLEATHSPWYTREGRVDTDLNLVYRRLLDWDLAPLSEDHSAVLWISESENIKETN